MDPDWLARDPRLIGARRKGQRLHRGRQGDAPERRARAAVAGRARPIATPAPRGQVELSTSPFYHPILPLLCDSDVHLRRIRTRRGRGGGSRGPDDARLQIERAIAFHEATFGSRPAGMWPSEGSVSDEAVSADRRRRASTGSPPTRTSCRARSNTPLATPDLLYRPYRDRRRAGRSRCFATTRCRIASAFTISPGTPRAAADDFVEQCPRCRAAGLREPAAGKSRLCRSSSTARTPGSTTPAAGGRSCARSTGALERAGDIQTVTMSEAASGPAPPLPSIFPGSWINGDFYIWIGHRDDHRAWDQLSAARAAFDARAALVSPEAAGPGARGNADRRRQRLVLVVRRRPLVRPRRRLRRPVPPPSCATPTRRSDAPIPGGAVRDQHQHRRRARSARAVGPAHAHPRRPGHQLPGVGGRGRRRRWSRPGGAMHEVAAPSLVAGRSGRPVARRRCACGSPAPSWSR